MNSAQRDTFLRIVLPAILVALGYHYFFSKQAGLTAAWTALETAKASAVEPALLPLARNALSEENKKQAEVKKNKEAMEARWTRLTSLRTGTPAQRTSALRQLTKMLWDRGLVPFEESPATTAVGQLPGTFDTVIRKISTNATTAQPRLWQIRFYGRYRDVTETLATLGDLDAALVPVGLTMSDAHPDTDWRVWTLLLWN